ncbi:hypothetical protein C7974DRAFT_375926 [Boeremia exigua]|uniref:uncharacterized protein n=1 Tax=Boeremia exigua TaxID=749465 RepID=UPI001E8E7906|nr:uncharacterized protein C7974DRAFT_375926 [Boeremia exigua]KAH6629035.1 hypothetical protein C7974DRAFT_375926 [Boeremia exigua]
MDVVGQRLGGRAVSVDVQQPRSQGSSSSAGGDRARVQCSSAPGPGSVIARAGGDSKRRALGVCACVPFSAQSSSCAPSPHHAGEQQVAAATPDCMPSKLGYGPCVQFAMTALASARDWPVHKPPWVLCNLSSPPDASCHSSSTPGETLCDLPCLNIRDAGLLATFAPSLANGTVRNRCCYVRPPSFAQAWPPSWRPSQVTQGPSRPASCRLTWGRSIQ